MDPPISRRERAVVPACNVRRTRPRGRPPSTQFSDAIRAWVTTTRLALTAVVGGYLEAHASEIRRPDHGLAGRRFMDAAESLIHTTALREPALLEDSSWLAEICDLFERYLLAESRCTMQPCISSVAAPPRQAAQHRQC